MKNIFLVFEIGCEDPTSVHETMEGAEVAATAYRYAWALQRMKETGKVPYDGDIDNHAYIETKELII